MKIGNQKHDDIRFLVFEVHTRIFYNAKHRILNTILPKLNVCHK